MEMKKVNLVVSYLENLHSVGVYVASCTHDESSSHFSMLLAKLKDSLDPSLRYPSNFSAIIYVFLDVCHMLKLVRNTFVHKVG